MAIEMTLGTPKIEVLPGVQGTSGVNVSVTATNGSEAMEAHQVSLSITGWSGDTSESIGDTSFPLDAFAAAESREVGGPVQLDPGVWELLLSLFDTQGNEVAKCDPQTVTVGGPRHHKEQFADSSKLQFTIEPTRVHKESQAMAKADYHLSCTGSVDILPGFPVAIVLTDSDGTVGEQIYNLERGVRRGASEPHFLHVACGDSKAGDTAKLTMIGDIGGAAQKDFDFTLTWKDDGTAEVAPA